MSLSTVIVAVNTQFLRRTDLEVPSLPGTGGAGRAGLSPPTETPSLTS